MKPKSMIYRIYRWMKREGMDNVMLAPWFVAAWLAIFLGLTTYPWSTVNPLMRDLLIANLVFVSLVSVIYQGLTKQMQRELEFNFGIGLPRNEEQWSDYQKVVDKTTGEFVMALIEARSCGSAEDEKCRRFWRAYNVAWANGFIVQRWMSAYVVRFQMKQVV